MKTITASLDALAEALETRGLTHLAASLDAVANSLFTPKPEEETEQYAEKYSALQDWVITLDGTTLGSNVTNRLSRLVQGTAGTPLSKATLESSPAWHGFLAWLQKRTTEEGRSIPDKYFHNGRPSQHYKWEDLAAMPDILDVKFEASAPGMDKTLDSARQESRARYDSMSEYERYSPKRRELEDLFRRPELQKMATIVLSPKFMVIDRLLKELQRQRHL